MSAFFDAPLFVTTFATLFVIMDPPGTVPVFLALTSAMTNKQRAKASLQAVTVAFGVIVVFTFFGSYIMKFLGISFAALQASGGLLLLLVALELLTGKMEDPEPRQNVNVALVPLGTPLLAGPGAIVASMVAVESSDSQIDAWSAIILAIIAVHLCLYAAMRFSTLINRVLGEGGTILVSRLAGMLLAAIAVQLIATGVFAFIDAYTGAGG